MPKGVGRAQDGLLAMVSEIYLEADNAARTTARTGIQSVVRGLISGLRTGGYKVYPLRWSFEKDFLTPLNPGWRRNLGLPEASDERWALSTLFQPRCWPSWLEPRKVNDRISVDWHPAHAGRMKRKWMLLPELMEESHARSVTRFARQRGMKMAGIFHDAIAWKHPSTVLHWTSRKHTAYMRAFAELDVVIAVSRESAGHFREFLSAENLPSPEIRVCGLAAEVPGEVRASVPAEQTDRPFKILCVSTLEPRKNHLRILNAFQEARRRLGTGRRIELHLAGAAYEAAPEIAGGVRALAGRDPAIHWHENLDKQALAALYRSCDFTVFGSWIEGFGIPVLESLWFGKPCLCSDQDPMAENAEGGGCLTVDVQDTHALAEGMVRLVAEKELWRTLEQQALSRPLKTWKDYGRGILEILAEIEKSGGKRRLTGR